jgi:hypothetical protein
MQMETICAVAAAIAATSCINEGRTKAIRGNSTGYLHEGNQLI